MRSKEQKSGSNFWLHFTYFAGMALCIVAFVIELLRGSHGNTLSWVYVIEWPILGATGTYLWWKLLHEHDQTNGKAARKRVREQLDAAAQGTQSTPAFREVVNDR